MNLQLNNSEILNSLILKISTRNDFKFWLRRRNTNERLDKGFWFNGTDKYIHIGVTKVGSGNLSTQSIGFVIHNVDSENKQCGIEILFKGEKRQNFIDCYSKIAEELGGFDKKNRDQFVKVYSGDIWSSLDDFFSEQYPKIMKVIKDCGLSNELEIDDEDFEKSLSKTLQKQKELESKDNIKILLANITWNSNDWKKISEDASGHAWVGGANIPHESWNFDLDNVRNPVNKVYGFAKFTHPPKVEGNNNLIVFYSQNKIVGFYGKAEILKDWVSINEQESYNLIGEKDLAVVLENKIENLKEKGFLEDKERVGQIGFSYLENTETILRILEESILLNESQSDNLNKIKSWIESESNYDSHFNDEERLIKRLIDVGIEDSEKFYSLMELIIRELHLPEDDKRICYSLPKNKLIGLTIGQKYCTIIEKKGNQNTYKYFDTLNNQKNWLIEADSVDSIKNEIDTIINAANEELKKTYKTGYSNYSSLALQKSLFDKTYKTLIFNKAFQKEKITQFMNIDLNQIFYGPPGTGKTYNTINEAIKIADPEFFKTNQDNRVELKKRFKLLMLNKGNESIGQIAFTTFHQSMSYEDFIEGIKPVLDEVDVTSLNYKLEDGIFKWICNIAKDSINAVAVKPDSLLSLSQDEFEKAHFYKMSLGNSQSDLDNEIYDYCIQNNCISLGWGDGYDYTGMDEKAIKEFAIEKGIERFSVTAINQFKILLKIGDYVIISHGNNYVRAIGKVVSEYEFRDESPFANNSNYNQFRNVEWIFTDKSIPATEIYNKNLSQQTIYQLIKSEIKQEFFIKEKKVDLLNLPKNPKNYVLIIDEINRGNVSSIFGELITLIEKDKRAGTDEELSVKLPYSKDVFNVPKNVYIVGTMNTADRSIEALDTALRRRFSFTEMPPKPELISKEGKLKAKGGKIGDIDVVEILKVINDRLEKLIDKDHKIGHSYFLGIETLEDLKRTFQDKVIPLLEEYFFGDFGKISLVLGNSFITKSNKTGISFAKNNDYDSSIANDLLDRNVYKITDSVNWDFKAIYE
jgi:hypothetical protein